MDHAHAVSTLASERYLLGEMAAPERDAFEEHFFSCTDCAEDVRAGALLREGSREGFVRASSVAAFRPRTPRRFSVALPWAMAATLACVAAYQSLWVLPELQRQAGPQALAPFVLRPATRGTDPVVTLQAGHPVTLAVDVNAPESVTELSYELKDAGGSTVLTGRAPMPAPGVPLLLLVPGRAFGTPGRYILRLSDTTNSTGPLGEYRFMIERR